MRGRLTPVLSACLPFVILLGGAEVAFRASSMRDALRDAKRHSALPHRYRSIDFDPDAVFLGDSRTMYGVDPEAVSRAVLAWSGRALRGYNLALPGAPPVAQLALLDHVLDRGQPPRFVVMHVSPYMFSTENEEARVREALYSVFTVPGAYDALRVGMPLEDALVAAAHASSELLRYRRGFVAHVVERAPSSAAERLSRSGVASMPNVPYATQRRAAEARAREFARIVAHPRARFDEQQLRYLEVVVRRLRGAGSRVALVASPTSSPLWRNDGPGTIVPEFMDRMAAAAARLGVDFHDHRRSHPIRDFEFADGDHPSRPGALRYSTFLARDVLVPMITGAAPPHERFVPPAPHRGCALVDDFESLSMRGWRLEGRAFDEWASSGASGVSGFLGVQLLSSRDPSEGDAARGVAVSAPFVLDRQELRLRVGGGRDPRLAVQLLVDGTPVRSARGKGTGALDQVRWNVEDVRGRTAEIVVVDDAAGRGGHILVDHIEQCTSTEADGEQLGGT
jgi:hypothetical protein